MNRSTANRNGVKNATTDFKAEVIAAELVDSGVPLDLILILMLGGSKRPYRKDVEEITEDISEYDHKEYTQVKTHKEGIYDKLPQGLFHSPTVAKSANAEEEILLAMKRHHIEEANARKFFLPFEASINNLRIQIALHENRLDKRLESNDLIDIFSKHWNIFKWLDARQANIFLHLLPLIHEVRDDLSVAATIFELFFQIPVQISIENALPVKPETPAFSSFNDAVLGINFTTGNTLFYTGEDEIKISIGPMESSNLQQFISGDNNEKILELLCDYLMPAHLDVNIEYKLLDADRTTRLTDSDNSNNSSLGLSTFL
jgi:hypothetical protein